MGELGGRNWRPSRHAQLPAQPVVEENTLWIQRCPDCLKVCELGIDAAELSCLGLMPLPPVGSTTILFSARRVRLRRYVACVVLVGGC